MNGSTEDDVATLDENASAELVKPVSKKEVYDALMSMKSYKAPGPDGFQPIFFKLFWDVVGDDLWKFIQLAFEKGVYDPKVCESLIVLLPKGESQNTFKDFRPISLCNVTYKLISKIIVSRMRPFLDGIISPLQNSFIPGRSTKDNAIVLQEVLHFARKFKRKNGDMVFKLDLDKAYDRVNWKFLQDTLLKFKFSPVIISLIMFGLTHSSNTILWNGSKTEAFTPVRGLRQGDPLSPYLFVLCMERLGAMIERQVNISCWKPMQMVKNGTKLSHLFFADDVLLFAKATTNQAQVIKEVLDNFCAISGLMISHAKSRFYTSAGVSRHIRENIAGCSQIQATDRFEKYLGFKMFHGYGGLLRNKEGKYIWGFYGSAAMQNILFAEIMAIWYGLKLCWERGFRKVLCCSDSLLSVNLIKEGVTAHHRLANEICCIRKLLANDWEVILTHTLREGNACADVLAKLGTYNQRLRTNNPTKTSWSELVGVEGTYNQCLRRFKGHTIWPEENTIWPELVGLTAEEAKTKIKREINWPNVVDIKRKINWPNVDIDVFPDNDY
ncbi:unnamed protein product [Trifolium pratense]|uniref:Uncharacterized protein n=1 Tax=Trifolium pratense TaxID=57577 RepID=A0ACB0J226_TRIPR|nr:unnamed protein product [Trifolium pratense]